MVAAEALQCPTLLYNGYGAHRIEGIGDKHVPWIHNIKNMDVVAGHRRRGLHASAAALQRARRARSYLERGRRSGVGGSVSICSASRRIANLLTAIKTARYFEMGARRRALHRGHRFDSTCTSSRLAEERELHGAYSPTAAAVDHERYLLGEGIDHMQELGYWDRKRMHNLKYFTWVEQQGKSVEELDAQWYDDDYWTTHFHAWESWDRKIDEFNERTGLLARYR